MSWWSVPARASDSAPYWHIPTPWPKPRPAKPATSFRIVTDTFEDQSTTWQDQLLQKMVAGLVSRDYSIFILAAAIFQKLAWFLWVAAIGVHVFWITLVVLLLQTGRLKRAIRLLPVSFLQRSLSRFQ